MADSFDWLFVDFIPLLYERKRVAKQVQIETWLDLATVLKELNIEKIQNKQNAYPAINYII